MSYTAKEFVNELAKLGIRPVYPLSTIIYKYVSFDTALKIIEKNSLLFSAPTTFNDPFDLNNALIDKTCSNKQLREWIDTIEGLSNSHKKLFYKNNKDNPLKLLQILDETLKDFKTTAGICCFSKSYKNPLMWSHYADKHAGICLGFNITPNSVAEFTILEVSYIDQIIPISYYKNTPLVFMYWIFTKSNIWSYEEEVRAVYNKKNGILKFEKSCLQEIHFGLRTTEKQRNEFKSMLSSLKYNIQKMTLMKMDTKTFDLKATTYP